MTEERRLQIVTGASITLLPFVSAFANGTIAAGVAGGLAIAGLVALPRLRKRGSLALLIGASVAAMVAAVARSWR